MALSPDHGDRPEAEDTGSRSPGTHVNKPTLRRSEVQHLLVCSAWQRCPETEAFGTIEHRLLADRWLGVDTHLAPPGVSTERFREAFELVACYIAKHGAPPDLVEGTEIVSTEHAYLTGTPDAVTFVGDDGVLVTDWKTGWTITDCEFQLRWYCSLLMVNHPTLETFRGRAEFIRLDDGVVDYGPWRRDELMSWWQGVLDAIPAVLEARMHPVPTGGTACGHCQLRSSCPEAVPLAIVPPAAAARRRQPKSGSAWSLPRSRPADPRAKRPKVARRPAQPPTVEGAPSGEPAAEERPDVRPKVRARSERRQFVTHNLIASGGAVLAGLLGFGLQALMSHTLRPGAYGQAFAVFTFFILLTQPAGAFGRLMAWTTSRELATTGRDDASTALLRSAELPLLLFGLALAGVCFAAAGPLSGYLHVPEEYVYASAAGVPFMIAAPALLGGLQGEQRFRSWGFLSAFIAGSRVVCVAALVIPFGVVGVLLGISLASALTYLVGIALSWHRLRRDPMAARWRPVVRFLSVSVVAALCLAVMLGSDTLMVEHLFSRREGGEYGSVVAISRAVFFAMGGATSVLFPKVVARHAKGHSTIEVVVASLGMALAGGVLAMLIFDWQGRLILHLFAGRSYTAGASYMGLYALGMGLLAAGNMLMNTQQSLDRLWLIWVLVPLAALKPALIALFHDSLTTVVLVSDLATGVFLVGLTLLYVAHERDWGRSRAAVPAPEIPSVSAAPRAGRSTGAEITSEVQI